MSSCGKINYIFLLLFSSVIIGCSSNKITKNKQVYIIKQPSWIQEEQYINKMFYSIGEANGNSNIKMVLDNANADAFEKAKQSIKKHLNSIYYRNLAHISNQDRKDTYYSRIEQTISNVINNEDLSKYTIRENNWLDIDGLKMYVLIYIEPNIIKTFLMQELKSVNKQYSYDEAFVFFLEQLWKDIEKNFSLIIEDTKDNVDAKQQEKSMLDDKSIGAKIDEIELKEKQRNDIITKTITYTKNNN